MGLGRAFAVVGPSGAGKDSIMEAGLGRSGIHIVQRLVTRPSEAGGEPFRSVTPDELDALRDKGEIALEWGAHGLQYAIPATAAEAQKRGETVVMNLSRQVLHEAAEVFPGLRVIHITANPQVLAQRLLARGRESAEDVARRLKRAAMPLDAAGLSVTQIDNSGALTDARDAFLSAIETPKDSL